MIERLKKIGYSFLYAFCIIPFLTLLLAIGYKYFVTIKAQDNLIAEIVFVFVAIVAYIIATRLIMVVFYKKNVDLIYNIIMGLITVVLSAWIVVYFKTKADILCDIAIYGNSPTKCVNYIYFQKAFLVYAVIAFNSYLFLIVMTKMSFRKVPIIKKKQTKRKKKQ